MSAMLSRPQCVKDDQTSLKSEPKYETFHSRKYILRMLLTCDEHTVNSLIQAAPNPKTYVSRLFLQLSLPNPLKPGVKLRMKM